MIVVLVLVGSIAAPAAADEPAAGGVSSAEDLAKKLANPIASLISVPFQFNYDENIGPADDGTRVTMNFQPVVPMSLNDDWNMISRTILPVIWQEDVAPKAGEQFGTGDIVQSLFFSPKEPTNGGLVWGLGPVFLLPTASDEMLGGEKWGAGPTIVLLKQSGHATFGALMNHVWSFAGDEDRGDVDASYIQPFFSYTTTKAVTFGLSTESTYNWEADDWAIPMVFNVSKLTRVGKRPVSIGGGVRYWADPAEGGPEGWSGRFIVTLLFPK
jgi:hypothetical protein